MMSERSIDWKSGLGRIFKGPVAIAHGRLADTVREYKDTRYAPYLLAGPFLAYLAVLFVIPLAYMLVVSFYTNVDAGLMKPILTVENYVNFFTNGVYLSVVYNTVEISVLSTVFTVLVSFPVAYYIVFSDAGYTKYLVLLVIAPMLVGNVVRAFGWFALIGDSGVINQVLGLVGLHYTLLKTKPGLIIAISSVLMPFVILILMSVFYTFDEELIEAGYNLGGNHLQTFRYVTLPLALPGIFASTLLCFVLTMGTFATAVFIGMPEIPMIGPFIYNVANQANWPLAAAMSFVLLLISFALIYVYTKVVDLEPAGEGIADTTGVGRSNRFRIAKVLNVLDFGRTIGGVSLASIIFGFIIVNAFVYLLIPVLFAIQISFNPSTLYAFPPEYLTLKWYVAVLSRGAWVSSFITSFEISVLSAVLSIALSAPTAYAINRYDFPGRKILDAGTFLPLMIPQITLGLSLLIFLDNVHLDGTILGLGLALGVTATPYATRTILATMHNFDNTVEEAAKSLGADEVQTFVYVTLPELLPGVITAAILSFIVSYSNLTIAVFIQGAGTIPIPVRIYSQMQYGANPSIAAVATINIVIVLTAIVIIERLFGAAEAVGLSNN